MTDRITSRFGMYSHARQVAEGHDLTGRTAIVTGGASGLGLETARVLTEAGAAVTLAVRNEVTGEAAAADINKTAGVAKAEVRFLDLSSLASVSRFAAAWGDAPLHLLINNAGVMACPQSYTSDDLEMQIGTNHFGHYLLAALLTPNLRKGASDQKKAARVIALTSIGHRRSAINFEDPHFRRRPYEKWEAYGQSKTADALFAVGFNARFRDSGVNANAVMPGGIMTSLQRHLPHEEMVGFGWLDEAGDIHEDFKTAEQGASTTIWAATAPELEGVGGLYLEDCAQAAPWSISDPFHGYMPHAVDPEAADRLWTLSVETTGAG